MYSKPETSHSESANECCASGRRCDEICVEIAVAEECLNESTGNTPHAIDIVVNAAQVEPNREEISASCITPEIKPSSKCGNVCSDFPDNNENPKNPTKNHNTACTTRLRNHPATEATGTSSTFCTSISTPNSNTLLKRKSSLIVEHLCCRLSLCASSSESCAKSKHKADCCARVESSVEKYESYLRAGLCVCRKAIGQLNLCWDGKTRREHLAKRRRLGVQDRCDPQAEWGEKTTEGPASLSKCGSEANSIPGKCEDVCCKSSAGMDASLDTCCLKSDEKEHKKVSTVAHSSVNDVENAAAREQVSFSIAGMTCTGCVKKLNGVLQTIPEVTDINVNFVAATGSFALDSAETSAKTVLQRLEKETGFKCSRYHGDVLSIQIIMTKTQAETLQQRLPMLAIEKNRAGYTVKYNPHQVGARDILRLSEGQLAPPSDSAAITDGRKMLCRTMMLFGAAAIFTIPVCVLAWADLSISYAVESITSLICATVVQFTAIPAFYSPALKAMIFSRSVEMDMLVVISITAAYFYSVVAFGLTHAGIELGQGAFFETSTLLITLVLLGRLISSYAKVRAISSISTKSLQADFALIITNNGDEATSDARLLHYGDLVKILPHTKIVSDGDIVQGESAVDEAMITGEAVPVTKSIGDHVVAGTINGDALLIIKITRLPGQNSISDIANLVQDALNAKPRIQDLADTIAGYFVPVVVVIAVIVLVVWLAIAFRVRNLNAGGSIGLSITYAVAVLAVSCPCALGLAVPMVLIIAGGVAAKAGVIIKQAHATERAHYITDVVFDKTGTLTEDKLSVVREEIYATLSDSEARSLAYALVKDNSHPVSAAVSEYLRQTGTIEGRLDKSRTLPGRGIEGAWKGARVRAGNPHWLSLAAHPFIKHLSDDGLTLLAISLNDRLVMCFGLESRLRPESRSVVASLHAWGIKCHIVSGDQPLAVAKVAQEVCISTANTASRQSPADKQAYLKTIATSEKKILFIGDGTNDAVAIAQADVGVQIGSSSEVTRATADVVLLGSLNGIPVLLDISRKAYRRIVFNFAWAAVYNLVAILLAAGAFVRVRIPPSFAGLGEIVSVLPVIIAALTLMRQKVRKM